MSVCEECGAGQTDYDAAKRWEALERIAVIENGPAFLHRCGYCGTLWEENLRGIWVVTPIEAKAHFPSAPV